MARTFQDFCSENLAQFGMSMAVSDITCIDHARHQAADEPTGLAGGTGIDEVIGETSQ